MINFLNKQGTEVHSEVYSLTRYLQKLGIWVNKSKLERYLYTHYSFPALLSVVDFLDYSSIPYTLLKDEQWEENLNHGLIYFNGVLCVIQSADHQYVQLLDTYQGMISVDRKTFKSALQDNFIISVDKRTLSLRDHLYGIVQHPLSVSLLTSLLSVAAGLFIYLLLPLSDALLLTSNLVGLWFTYQLQRLKFSEANKSRICLEIKTKSLLLSCKNILASQFSKIKGYDLADVGMATFLFFISLQIATIWIPNLRVLMGVSLLFSIPVIILSIGYQIRVATICFLCVGVQLTLLAEIATQLPYLNSLEIGAVYNIVNLIFLALTGSLLLLQIWITVISYLRGLLQDYHLLKDQNIQFTRIKRDPFWTSQLLNETIPQLPAEDTLIYNNRDDATHTLLLMLKLGCRFCPDTLSSYYDLWNNLTFEETKLIVYFVDLDATDTETLDRFVSSLKDSDLKTNVYQFVKGIYQTESNEMIQERNKANRKLAGGSFPKIYINQHKVKEFYTLEDVRALLTFKKTILHIPK